MPSKIPFAREIAYLRALADTGNAMIAAAHAAVSRTWAYKRREVDARFDGLLREMVALAKARPPERRDRAGGWSEEVEARFLDRLRQTCSVPAAAAEVGLSTVSAYRRRQRRPAFAAAWDEAPREGWAPIDQPWMEAALHYLEGEPPPPGNPVRFKSIRAVIDAMEGKRIGPRRPR